MMRKNCCVVLLDLLDTPTLAAPDYPETLWVEPAENQKELWSGESRILSRKTPETK